LLLCSRAEDLSRFTATVRKSLFTLGRLIRANGVKLGIWVPNKHLFRGSTKTRIILDGDRRLEALSDVYRLVAGSSIFKYWVLLKLNHFVIMDSIQQEVDRVSITTDKPVTTTHIQNLWANSRDA
jgi:hypothetical protein